MLGVDHDNILLLPTPFPTILMLGNCIVVIIQLCSMLEINDVVLYCIVLYCIVLCEGQYVSHGIVPLRNCL